MKIKTILILGCTLLSCNMWGQQLHNRDKALPCFEKTFSILAHVPKDTFGELTINEAQIQAAIDTMNVYFSPICMRFELCEINVIDNFQYAIPRNTNEWTQMKVKYQQNNRINVFFPLDIPWVPFDCGYSDLSGLEFPQRDGIMVKSPCIINRPKSFSHEMGHYFGLLDTFEEMVGGPEAVDGSNCETAGDFICDTPADPYVPGDTLTGKYLSEEFLCRFIFTGRDRNRQYYVPDVGNMMTLYPDTCRCGFTQGQYLKMGEVYREAERSW